MKVTINGKDIELVRKFRSYVIYEAITAKMFKPESLTDIMMYFYSVVLASDPSLELTLADFMDWLDGNDEKFTEFSMWLSKGDELAGQYHNKDDEESKKAGE